jgi:hypothetical protein
MGHVGVFAARGSDPYADSVVSYDVGVGGAAGFDNPAVTLGSPERVTGELAGFPGVVSMFSGPFGTDELFSIGTGGHLTVRFDEPVTDAASHKFGVDLIVFGNAFFSGSFPDGTHTDPAGIFSEPAMIEVSADGVTFFEVPDVFADALFPTQGYRDAGPFDASPGSVPTGFRIPVNPALALSDFDGLSFADALDLYDGSGGGTPVDLADAVDGLGQPAGLTEASYVRITPIGGATPEIDAFVAVPEPGTAALLLAGIGVAMVRRRTG